MEKHLLAGIIGGTLLLGTTFQSKAQINIHINIGTQPTWGPTGYQEADYYYLPDIESYYSVSTHQFIYMNGGRWVYANNLPPQYGNYDLYSGYKVVVNRPRPFLNFNQDRVQYARYKGNHGRQEVIRDSRDERYHGNPHGMPPGQAKKYDNRDDRRDNRGDNQHGDQGHGNDKHDNGHGNDKHDNGHGNKHGDN
jgi:hypothetical protein